uniref:asparagine synthase (glutamine-hydrolyzing) n=1 Tax=viral metagenome TaxID=1070528 RepID=A0A6C0HDF8_9ZZZZ
MCGIFSILNNEYTFKKEFIKEQFMKGQLRGPEYSKLVNVNLKCTFGFHRLAINGINSESNQPITIGDISLICNGEIYNYLELYQIMGVEPTTDSDCEVIIHLYKKYGIEQTLQMLDGVFAFILMDSDINAPCSKIYVARDPYGVRPLYQVSHKNAAVSCDSEFDLNRDKSKRTERIFAFASELKVLNEFYNSDLIFTHTIDHFKPGTYSYFNLPFKVSPEWTQEFKNKVYHTQGFNSIMYNHFQSNAEMDSIFEGIQHYFTNAVKKRALITDRPVACLLSGGLDSSLVTALVNEFHKEYNEEPLETYSIGLEGSEDLKYAKIVANYLGTKHTTIQLTEEQFFAAIPDVICAIESYDTTTVRASIGNYLVSKYIANNSQAKVIFNGDGADELCGGYLYMHSAPDAIEFDKETRRLLNDIYMYDVLRSDKSISSNGLEPRTPFLDRSFVQYYLSLHPSVRYHPGERKCEKYLIRTAFSKEKYLNTEGKALLPDEIIWRTKEAFSDGVSKITRSLYQILQDFITMEFKLDKSRFNNLKELGHNTPDTQEKMYYRKLFEEYYPNMSHIVPYFWMPKYVNATDASARTLSIYKEISNVA